MEQPHVVAQSIHGETNNELSNRELWASVCYHYPQYTLEQASRLSKRDIVLLLKTAKRLRASEMLELVQIVASPHTKKGKGVKQLSDYYKREIGK